MAGKVSGRGYGDTTEFDPGAPVGAADRNSAWFRVLRRLDAGEVATPQGGEEESGEGFSVGGLEAGREVIAALWHVTIWSGRLVALSLFLLPAGRSCAGPPQRAARMERHVARATKAPKAPGRPGSGRKARAATPDSFRAQHQLLEDGLMPAELGGNAARGDKVVVNRAESPLGWLRHRRDRAGRPFLSGAQFEAGEALRRDFEIAGMSPRVTTDLSGRVAGDATGVRPDRMSPTELQLAAKQRFDRAYDFVGPGLDDVLVRVCCFLEGIESVEKALGWPSRSGKLVLTLALDRLARHYGLA